MKILSGKHLLIDSDPRRDVVCRGHRVAIGSGLGVPTEQYQPWLHALLFLKLVVPLSQYVPERQILLYWLNVVVDLPQYWPAAHLWSYWELLSVKYPQACPSGQLWESLMSDIPFELHTSPSGHGRHWLTSVNPLWGEKVLCGQGLHVSESSFDL